MKRLIRKKRLFQRLIKKNRKQESPVFERLEPRLLLNADITGLTASEELTTPIATQNDNTIQVDINQTSSLTAALVAATPQSVPYSQDFAAGKPTDVQGWEYYSDNEGQINVVGGQLLMDDYGDNYSYSLNEAILHLNLTDRKEVTLKFDHTSYADEPNAIPTSFSGHYKGDGVALSVDGINWIKVTALTSSFVGYTTSLDSIIELAKAAAGSNDLSNVRIKFQQYDNTSGNDGRSFDNIQVTALSIQQLPYSQDFSGGKPTAAQGWEYYSDNQGQIQVTAEGRLRLDDSVADYSYSLNEAILHLNLTGQTSVKLKLDHYTLADEVSELPVEFTGHYKGDGISLSVDGIHWVRITNLSGNFTAQEFELDAKIAQAKALAGSTDVSNVRIKFQQYDNTYSPSDGREFDNIQVTAEIKAQAAPYTQDFSGGKPTTAQGWEYYSTNEGQIQVVSGRLQMDDYGDNWSYSSNEAILHVDLTGLKNTTLTLDHISIGDEDQGIPVSYSGHYKGDAISLSVDGINWIRITNLTTSFTGQTFALDSLLALAKTAAGSTDVSNVRIKFQQYDNTSGNDGRAFDNIVVTGLAIQEAPYVQTFDSGKPTKADGWEYYSDSQGQIQVVNGYLLMDDYGDDNVYSLNEAILHINLTNKKDVILSLDHTSYADENTALPASFSGHWKGDGIAISVDGVNWVTVTNLTTSFINQSFNLDTLLNKAKIVAGSNDVSDVRIKFQQYDNTSGNDGRSFDNINITAFAVQDVPYAQTFDAGKPTKAEGWEYYSDNTGQIQVVDGRLRMDDYVDDWSYSSNEAILHVNLTGKSNVTLTLDHTSLADENTAIPTNFTGHFKGDGIALSVDGVNWVKVTDLTSSFTGQDFALDSIIALAKTAAGSTDVSNVRIKFQQYDNTSGNDGREFDNIHVTASIAQNLPYSQDFSTGLPSAADGWEYYSDNQGQIQVISGSLLMDDFGDDYSYSLNEAILHLDLTGKTNVTLTLDHTSLADENQALPASFTGHYKGDGISISVDGIHWIKITDLTTSFTGQSFSLDTAIAQAASAAGSSDLSNVQIKFQQYDNTSGNDGRKFDNIQITSV